MSLLKRPDEQLLKAVKRLQGNADLALVLERLEKEFEQTKNELYLKTDNVVLRQFQGRAQVLAWLLATFKN